MNKWIKPSLIILIAMTLIAGCSSNNNSGNSTNANTGVETGSEVQEKPYAGETLTLYVANHVWGEGMQTLIPEFEENTGIKVNVESFAEAQLTKKVTVQFSAGAATPDVFMFRPGNEGALLLNNGWAQPLDEFVKKDPSYDINDFSQPSLSAVTFDQQLIGIPGVTAQHILYYRKDLLEDAGIAVPTTMEELKEAVQTLHDPDNQVYGFLARGQTAALVTMLSSFIFSEGGDFMEDGKAAVNSPAAIRAATTYGTLLRDYGPPGVLNMEWPQAVALFSQGNAVFYADGSPMFPNFIDQETSVIVDSVGYAEIPAGEGGSKPFNVTPWGLAMNAKSGHKDASWELIKWLTNKENTLITQQMGNSGARMSVWEHPDGAKAFPEELVKVVQQAGINGVPHQLPQVTSVGEARDIIGDIVTQIILGNDPEEAANKQNELFQKIIDRDNENK